MTESIFTEKDYLEENWFFLKKIFNQWHYQQGQSIDLFPISWKKFSQQPNTRV